MPHSRDKLKCTKRKIRDGNPGYQNKQSSWIDEITENILKGERETEIKRILKPNNSCEVLESERILEIICAIQLV